MDEDATEQKEQHNERRKHANSRVEGQNRRRLGQIMDMGTNAG